MSRYNWRNVLSDFAAISGVLAGFTITLIVFILGWKVADTIVFALFGITWGHIGVLLNGIAAALLVTASEFFLGSKEFDMWALPERYEEQVKQGKDWDRIRKESLSRGFLYENRGRFCYNTALILMFFSMFCIIAPYNMTIAAVVGGFGILLQAYQWYIARSRRA